MVRKQKKAEATTSSEMNSSEAKKRTARERLEQGIPEDMIVKETGLSPMVIRGLKSGQARARKREAEAQKQAQAIQTEASNIRQNDGEGLTLPHTLSSPGGNMASVMPSPSPPNQTMPSPQYREVMPNPDDPDFQRLLRDLKEAVGANAPVKAKMWNTILENWKRERRMTQRGRSVQGADGHGVYQDSISTREILNRLQVQQMIDKMGGSQQQNQIGFKEFLQMMQLAQQMSGGKNPQTSNRLEDYRIGRLDEGKIRDQLQSAQTPSPANEWNLQVEKLKSERDLSNRKLDWNMQLHKEDREDKRESSGKMWDTVKSAIEGPVKTLTKQLGSAGAERIRGNKLQTEQPEIVRAQCPNCGGQFPANPELISISCPLCGVTLSKQQPEEPKQIIKEKPNEPQKEPIDRAKPKKKNVHAKLDDVEVKK